MARPNPGGGTPPIFERIAIVGFGLIGGSVAMAARARWPAALIVAVDRKDVLETAMRMHAADVGGDDLVMASEADLILLAAPVRANIDILRRLPDYVPGEAIVTDVGSTKREIVDAAEALPARLRFIGGHPLAGAATGGLAAARPDLFAGRPWILTPAAGAPDADALKLGAFIEALGGTVEMMSPVAHDHLAAYLSHLPQLAISALMHVVGEHAGAAGLSLAGRGLRDTTRLASSPSGIWRDIVSTNNDHVVAALDELIAILQAIRRDAETADGALERIFESAARWKQQLERAE
jgi:prephenate dehydrogenase